MTEQETWRTEINDFLRIFWFLCAIEQVQDIEWWLICAAEFAHAMVWNAYRSCGILFLLRLSGKKYRIQFCAVGCVRGVVHFLYWRLLLRKRGLWVLAISSSDRAERQKKKTTFKIPFWKGIQRQMTQTGSKEANCYVWLLQLFRGSWSTNTDQNRVTSWSTHFRADSPFVDCNKLVFETESGRCTDCLWS